MGTYDFTTYVPIYDRAINCKPYTKLPNLVLSYMEEPLQQNHQPLLEIV